MVGLPKCTNCCQMVTTTCKLGGAVVMPRDMSYKSETVLNWITTTDETWARAYDPELKKTGYQMLSSTFTKKTQGVIKSVTQKDDRSFWRVWKVCMCVTLFTGVRLQIHRITRQFCNIRKVLQLRRNMQERLRMLSPYVLML